MYVYSQIVSSVQERNGKVFFLNVFGRTENTLQINLSPAKFRSGKYVAFTVTSSDSVATLPEGGKTAMFIYMFFFCCSHKCFKKMHTE